MDNTNREPLLIRIDDAGSSDGANRAILEAIENLGTDAALSVGIMAVTPATEAFCEAVRGRDLGNVDLGLHLCCNAEWESVRWGPLGPTPGYTYDDGTFHKLVDEHSFEPGPVIEEGKRQLARLRSLGIEPSYMDEHMCFTWHREALWREVCDWAAGEGMVPAYRHEPTYQDLPGRGWPSEGALLDAVGRRGELTNKVWFWCTHPETTPAEQWPGPADDGQQRRLDHANLTDPDLPRKLADAGLRCVRYTEL